MTTPADRVAAHNARRHNRDADPLCSLCPATLPIDDVKQPYIFNASPSDHVVINGRLNDVRDVHYFYVAEYDNEESAFNAEPDSYLLLAEGLTGGTEIGRAHSEHAVTEAMQFVKRPS